MAYLARISHATSVMDMWGLAYRVGQGSSGDLTWLNAGGAPLLDTHQDSSLRTKVGTIRMAWATEVETLAAFDFEQTAYAQELEQRVRRRDVNYVSMAFKPLHMTRLKEADPEGFWYVVDSWYPLEVSLCAIPADKQAIILDHDFALPQPPHEPGTTPGRLARNSFYTILSDGEADHSAKRASRAGQRAGDRSIGRQRTTRRSGSSCRAIAAAPAA